MRHAHFLKSWAIPVVLALAPACASQTGDPPSPSSEPPPAGKEHRIREIADPASPLKAAHKTPVQVSGAVVVAVDHFDETRNGKSTGSIYVSDLGSQEPYSGISLFNPSFIPGNLRVSAGDTLDLRGEFQENQDIPITFTPGAFLVQLASPIATFRFDAKVPEPVVIDIADLADYATGRRWLNMLVTVKNVTIQGLPFGSGGRRSWGLLPEHPNADSAMRKCEVPFTKTEASAEGPATYSKPPTLVNELMDLEPLSQQLTPPENGPPTVVKSITGVVTFFCNLHIAPRTTADIAF